jgi:uncharacterized protein YjbI with pentapeptide repeats
MMGWKIASPALALILAICLLVVLVELVGHFSQLTTSYSKIAKLADEHHEAVVYLKDLLPKEYADVRKDSLQIQQAVASLATPILTPLVQLFIGGVALAGLFFTYRSVQIATSTLEVTRRNQTVERFSSAIDQLGKTENGHENCEARLGGIYSLAGVARDSDDYRQPVVDVLCAYVRRNSPKSPGDRELSAEAQTSRRMEVEAILRVMAELMTNGANLVGSNLSWTILRGRPTTPPSKRLALPEVILTTSELGFIEWCYLDLTEADFKGASLESATLSDNIMVRGKFWGASMSTSDLTNSDLRNAEFLDADLRRAQLTGSELQGSKFTGAQLQHAHLLGRGLTWNQLHEGIIDSTTEMPEHVRQRMPEAAKAVLGGLTAGQVMTYGRAFDSVKAAKDFIDARPR